MGVTGDLGREVAAGVLLQSWGWDWRVGIRGKEEERREGLLLA